MRHLFTCAHCGAELTDGETVYRNGIALYCHRCRIPFVEKNGTELTLTYQAQAFEPCTCAGCRSDVRQGQMIYLIDEVSPVYCTSDEFLRAERDRIAADHAQTYRRDGGGILPNLTQGRVMLRRHSAGLGVWKPKRGETS